MSQQRTLAALKDLERAGILRQFSQGTCGRQFVASELFDLLARYEASVVGRGA